VDYDDDGMLDLIVGDRNGYIHYYRRTAEAPITLTEESNLVCGGVTIDVGYNSAPVIVDWDEDGEMDLLVGNQSGNVRYYHNDTIDTDPVYNNYTNIESAGTAISQYRNCPQVVDMNQDGRKDLLCGINSYNILYYENVGTNAAPEFSGSEVMINTGGYGARFSVADWNGDGLLDVLASNYDGNVLVYIQQTTSIEGSVTEENRMLSSSANPFGSSVTIMGEGFSGGTITIYSMSGRTLVSESFNGSYTWAPASAPSGCYFAEVRDDQGSTTLNLIKL